MGMTGWTYQVIASLQWPQFLHALEGRGRMLGPLVDALLDVQRVTHLSDTPGQKGEPSGVQRVLDLAAARSRGERPALVSGADARHARAVAVLLTPYRGEPRREDAGEPIDGMSGREARAILAWIHDGRCPPDVYATELMDHLEHLSATDRADPAGPE